MVFLLVISKKVRNHFWILCTEESIFECFLQIIKLGGKQKKWRNRRKAVLKMQGGITLIALVISIIVMLILAGVSINAIVGENGILTRTQYATFLSEMSAVEEAVGMWKAGDAIDNQGETTAIPANGLCKVNDLTETERLVGEVG